MLPEPQRRKLEPIPYRSRKRRWCGFRCQWLQQSRSSPKGQNKSHIKSAGPLLLLPVVAVIWSEERLLRQLLRRKLNLPRWQIEHLLERRGLFGGYGNGGDGRRDVNERNSIGEGRGNSIGRRRERRRVRGLLNQLSHMDLNGIFLTEFLPGNRHPRNLIFNLGMFWE